MWCLGVLGPVSLGKLGFSARGEEERMREQFMPRYKGTGCSLRRSATRQPRVCIIENVTHSNCILPRMPARVENLLVEV